MPSLLETGYVCSVTWLGTVRDSERDIRSEAVQRLDLTFSGQSGDCHSGLTRPACSRTLAQHPRGTTIRNVRQLSIVSEEELRQIAVCMGVPSIEPASIGASMVVRGIPDFSRLPPSSRLQSTDSGATLCIDMENRPCSTSGRAVIEDVAIDRQVRAPKQFKDNSQGLRGVTAWVEREGYLNVGDQLKLHIPDQRPWLHVEEALSQSVRKDILQRRMQSINRRGSYSGLKLILVFVLFVFVFFSGQSWNINNRSRDHSRQFAF